MLVVKNLPANAGEKKDVSSVPESARSPGGGNGTPLQDSCLKNPMNRGAWRVTIHRVAESQTRLKWLSSYKYIYVSKHKSNTFCHYYFGQLLSLRSKKNWKNKVFFFLPSLILFPTFFFLYVDLSFWPILFSLSLKNGFNISYKAGLPAQMPSIFVWLRKSFFLLHFWRIISQVEF